MQRKILVYTFLVVAFLGLVLPKVFAEATLIQYGEIASIYNDEVKIRCKDPLSSDIYYFKFKIGWDSAFEGVSGKSGLKVGDFINVNYKLDLSQRPIATKISLPKDLSPKEVSRSGLQTYEGDNQEIKDLKEEIKSLKEEISQIKAQLSDKN
ncbi:MAG: hypothetical protein NTZ63_04585 [Candidatus Omnitrophica bacterium]|nr:hypothetical protein [Candidatus Omnitrophota bacterium]